MDYLEASCLISMCLEIFLFLCWFLCLSSVLDSIMLISYILYNFKSFKFFGIYFCSRIWSIFVNVHGHLKKIVFFCCLLKCSTYDIWILLVGCIAQIYYVLTDLPSGISISWWEVGLKVLSNNYCGFVYFSLKLYQFLLYAFLRSVAYWVQI